MSATELVCAALSQQRLRRSSDSVAAPSQQRCAQHQLVQLRRSWFSSVAAAPAPSRTRRAEWARRSWSAQLRRSSDSVAAPSQQRCAHHERSTGHWAERPLGNICQKQLDTIKPCDFTLFSL